MGANGSKQTEDPSSKKDGGTSKVMETPIFMDKDDNKNDQQQVEDNADEGAFPTPSGREYDLMDRIAADLPSIIDDQSKQQVQDYRDACDKGKGPMVACFATAEFVSLFERKHKLAADLYRNTCYRPKTDKSPNGVAVDNKSKAYPPGCFNLAQMLMTGKGGTKFDRKEAFQVFDRACRGGHGGACHIQAKMMLSEPGKLGPGIPYNPQKAADLLEKVCSTGDSISCFTLATMLLRGSEVRAEATNVTPLEAQGKADVIKRKNEDDRRKSGSDERVALKRDPQRAEKLLLQSCNSGHGPSCYNLAVMYTQGDDGIPADPDKAKKFQEKTEQMVKSFGGFGM